MKILFAVIAPLLVCGCVQTKIVEKNVPVPYAVSVYPNLPDIELDSAQFEEVGFRKPENSGSGLYVGVDKENAGKLLTNMATAGEREILFRKIVENENKRRSEWRDQNMTALAAAPELPENTFCYCEDAVCDCEVCQEDVCVVTE